MDQLAYFLTREIIKRVPFRTFSYLKVLKKLEYALYKALLAFILYSNSTNTNQFCLMIILCRVCSSFDYLMYPYYPAYMS